MKCPKCRSDNPETATFCADCGTRLSFQERISVSVTKTLISLATEGDMIAGRYRIIGKLGEGGMGVVYKAEDTRLKRIVALKFMPPELIRDSEAKERFIREAQAAAALSHPNICTIHEVDEEDGKPFISMEYVEGQSVRERIKEGPLDVAEALGMAMQAAQGLEEAHKKGIVHRDIKSANIMVTSSGQAKVMDFGLAKVFGASLITKEAKTMGTVAYMSPEQAQGQSVDHRTDIWSLGVVLYEMLTGQLPFGGEGEGTILYSIIHRSPEPMRKTNPKLKPALESAVEKALEKKPADRYQNMGEMLEDLQALAEGLKPVRAKARFFERRILGIKRIPFFAGLIVLAALIGFGLKMMNPSGGVEILDSIAILPLLNDSGDPSQDYFASSLTDMLIAEFYKISALRVTPRQAVLAYAKTTKSPQQIAKELDVKAIVEASVLRSGDKVRLIARLIDARQNQQIWGDTYERDLSDILFLQSDLARAIVKGIKVAVKPEERALLTDASKVNTEAYDLLMKGIEFYINPPQGITDPLSKGLEYFQKAIDIDPSLALAYAWKALFYLTQVDTWKANEKEVLPKALEAAHKSLELDDNLAMAHSTFAWIKLSTNWDFAGAEQEFKRAMELAPGDWLIPYFYNTFLCWTERGDEAIVNIRRRHEERRSGPESMYTIRLIYSLLWAHRYNEGLEETRKAINLGAEPKSWYIFSISVAYALNGMCLEALAEIDKTQDQAFWRTNPWWRRDHAWILALCGRREEALEELEEHKSLLVSDTAYDEACVYAGLGDKDKAFECLNIAYENHSPQMFKLKGNWCLHSLHGDPRFEELWKMVGFPGSSATSKK